MTTAIPSVAGQAPPPDKEPCKFTSEQYRWLIEEGYLTTYHKVELIEGEIRSMAPMGIEHGRSLRKLTQWLVDQRGQDYIVQCQVTIHLSEGFTPDPDFTLLRYREDQYQANHEPIATDVLLIIEVSESSLHYDLEVKSISYARANVPELWVVDIPHRLVHRFTQPSPDGYLILSTAAEEETISPELIPNLRMPVGEALPATVA